MIKVLRFKAILVLGPPGAGKSPFGDFLQTKEISGRQLWHFDFGREMRAILKNSKRRPRVDSPEYFSSEEINRIRQSIEEATLFEEEDRELAQKVLRHFLEKNKIQPKDILTLNGLPRHPGQVPWLSGLVEIKLLVHLICSEQTAIKRILHNLDGERSGRGDDSPEIIRKRYRVYRRRTEPLLDYLKQTELPVAELSVNEETRPENLWSLLERVENFRNIFF